MATSPTAPLRDDDPPHPNFDGIVFRATTDKSGVVVQPASAQVAPPISFLPIEIALLAATDLTGLILRIRGGDPKSYLADYLDTINDDLTAAIEACRPEQTH